MGTLTNVGLAKVAGLVNGIDTGGFTDLALGTSATAESPTQTALVSEITTNGGARAAATVSRETTNVANDTAKWEKIFTFTGDLVINECGIFDASNKMYLRHVFPSQRNVVDGDTLTLTVRVIQAQG